ncbi:MAG: carboxypeptidase-like regulatory domain-containing protein [Pyrinomonadaceae bacterium]
MSAQIDCVQEEFSKNLDQLKTSRTDGLRETGDLRAIMHTLLQHEARRIGSKLGERHPRTQQLNAQLKPNLEIINTLAVERELYQVEVPDVAEDAALVHGRVVDENGRGISFLVVGLLDEDGTPMRGVAESTTDTTGYYAIILGPDVTGRLCKPDEGAVFLAVFTGEGRLLFRHPKPLALTKGVRLVVGVSLIRSELFKGGGIGKPLEPNTVTVPDLVGPRRQRQSRRFA